MSLECLAARSRTQRKLNINIREDDKVKRAERIHRHIKAVAVTPLGRMWKDARKDTKRRCGCRIPRMGRCGKWDTKRKCGGKDTKGRCI